MMKPDYYESFLNNLPPEESVKGVINFIEFLEKHYIDFFKNIFLESKEKLIQIQEEPKNVCNEIQIELNSWKEKDGIKRLRDKILKLGFATEKELEDIEEEAKQSIEEAVEFAQNSPMPPLDTLEEDVYAD